MFRLPNSKIICKQYNKYRLPSFKSDIFLIEWLPNVKTDCHGHDQKNCNYIVLKGPLFEKRYFKNNELGNSKSKMLVYNNFDRGFINDSIGKHQMINFSNYKKWSIHRYS